MVEVCCSAQAMPVAWRASIWALASLRRAYQRACRRRLPSWRHSAEQKPGGFPTVRVKVNGWLQARHLRVSVKPASFLGVKSDGVTMRNTAGSTGRFFASNREAVATGVRPRPLY